MVQAIEWEHRQVTNDGTIAKVTWYLRREQSHMGAMVESKRGYLKKEGEEESSVRPGRGRRGRASAKKDELKPKNVEMLPF